MVYTDTDGTARARPRWPLCRPSALTVHCLLEEGEPAQVGVREVYEAERPALRRLQQVRVGA